LDGLFVPITNPITFRSLSDTKTILHLGDLHYGHPGFCAARWDRIKAKYRGRKDLLCIGMGDYWDFSRWSDRQSIRRSGVGSSAQDWLDDKVMDDVKAMADELGQFKWIGLLEGNHDWDFQDGSTATSRLADLLSVRYLGTCCYICHQIECQGCRTTLTHVCHHGIGGGARTIGASINSLEHWTKAFRATIYAMGHDHSSFVLPCTYTPLFGRINAKTHEVDIVEHESWFLRSGSMLRGYIPNERSYIATKALPARRLAYPELRIGIQRTREDGVRRLKATIEGINPAS
jgi:hypothetical protein